MTQGTSVTGRDAQADQAHMLEFQEEVREAAQPAMHTIHTMINAMERIATSRVNGTDAVNTRDVEIIQRGSLDLCNIASSLGHSIQQRAADEQAERVIGKRLD